MSEEEKQIEEGTQMEIGRISFAFTITRDEADAVINKPKGIVARKLRKYMISVLKAGCKKMLESKPDEEVKNCKVKIEE